SRTGDRMVERRQFLQGALGVSASAALANVGRPLTAAAAANTDGTKWRAFEVVTRAEIVNPSGAARVWLPLPLMPDTDYQKSLGQTWSGNAAVARVVRDDKYGAGIFYAEWASGAEAPVVELTTRFATRDRAVDFKQPQNVQPEDKTVLAKYLGGTT